MGITLADLMGGYLTSGQQRGGMVRRGGRRGRFTAPRQVRSIRNPSQGRRDVESGDMYLKTILDDTKRLKAQMAYDEALLEYQYPGAATQEEVDTMVGEADLEKLLRGRELTERGVTPEGATTFAPSGKYAPSPFEEMTPIQKRQALAVRGKPELIKLLAPEKKEVKPLSKKGKQLFDLATAKSAGRTKDVKTIQAQIDKDLKEETITETDKEYRQHLSSAIRGAFKGISFNKEQESLMALIETDPNKSEIVMRELERSMSPPQLDAFRANVDDYFTRYTPNPILEKYQKIRSREDTEVQSKVIEDKVIVKRGTHNGRPVVEYEDGTVEYAD